MNFRYILLLIMTFLNVTFISSQSDEDLSPHFYYYSREESAFIEESGNSQFRDTLVEFNLENPDLLIAGPGWSTTGRWFTWYTTIAGAAGGNNLYLFNNNDGTSYDVDDICAFEKLSWSNIGNYLLIDCSTPEFLILDVDTQSVILTLENTQIQSSETVEWIPESNLLAFYHPLNTVSEEYVMDIYDLDGQLLITSQISNSMSDNFHQIWSDRENLMTNLFFELDDTYLALSPSNDFFAYVNYSDCGNDVCILNNETGEIRTIPFIPEDTETFASASEVFWDSSGEWLIVAGNPVGTSRWLNVTNVAGDYSRSLTECTLSSSCFGWMPDVLVDE